MEVLGNTASAMDNRGGVSRTRSFDYSLFASELPCTPSAAWAKSAAAY